MTDFISEKYFPENLSASRNQTALDSSLKINASSPPFGAIYLRLSKDDEGSGESLSISNQRKLLLHYAQEHHFTIEREYIDDGYSGTNFDRPGFSRLIEDIRNKEIHLLLTKDLSRLGRDYIKTGEYTELVFPRYGVRFIAVGDGYDSAFSNSDWIPFRNVVNEMYARDISRKIRSALLTRMEDGSYIGNFAPYGYEAVGRKHRHLLPDPETAPIVAFLFQRACSGCLPSALAEELNDRQILCPSRYRLLKHPGTGAAPRGKGLWTANTIIKLLHNPVYMGDMVQGKTKKISFKSSVCQTVPPKKRIVVRHTHPPIVSEDDFMLCQQQLESRRTRRH